MPFVIFELIIQFAFQVPFKQLHRNGTEPDGWQRVIGLINIWELGEDNLPTFDNISNIVLKCLMLAFIFLQNNICQSEQYLSFTRTRLAAIRSFSDRKAESMAYLYNNEKLKITMKNQLEKDKMMRKLGNFNTINSFSTSKQAIKEMESDSIQ